MDTYFESFTTFNQGIFKRLQSPKILNLIQGKDWRCLEALLRHFKEILPYVDAPGLYFGKSGLLTALLRSLKKRLIPSNRALLITVIRELLVNSSTLGMR